MQEAGTSPLMPFDDGDVGKNFSDSGPLLKLVSFSVMDVGLSQLHEDAISVCGYLSIGITRNHTLSDSSDDEIPRFWREPGISQLMIPFEGLIETEEQEGEILICLLGTSVSPFLEDSSDPSRLPMAYSSERHSQSPLLQDNRLMLVLWYPQMLSLTGRVIHGEMRSLNQISDPKYFDEVFISSQLSYYSKYQFVSKACSLYACQDGIFAGGLVKDMQFCTIFLRLSRQVFDIVSDSGCYGTQELCYNWGPFMLEHEVETTNRTQDKFRIMMKDLHCIPGDKRNKLSTAKASTVFRVVSSQENLFVAEARTGLSGMTIFAEGRWNSSSRLPCMVGCVALAETGSDGCNSRRGN